MSTPKFIILSGIAFEVLTAAALAVASRVTLVEFETGTWHWWSEILFWLGVLCAQPYVLVAQALNLPRWMGIPGLALNALFWGTVFHGVRLSLRGAQRGLKARSAG